MEQRKYPPNLRKVEFEVKLPGVDSSRIFSFLICEGQAQLDDFQEINITPEELILVVNRATKFTNGSNNNSRKLCVLHKEKGVIYCNNNLGNVNR